MIKTLLYVWLLLFLIHTSAISTPIRFEVKDTSRLNDGSVSNTMELVSENPLFNEVNDKAIVFGREVESKWNKKFHNGTFLLEKSLTDSRTVYTLHSSHSIRYEVKAVSDYFTEDKRKIILCAKINTFLYGKRDFNPDKYDHVIMDKPKYDFPLEIVDKDASTNYWIQIGQKINIKLNFLNKSLKDKKIKLFIRDCFVEDYETDSTGSLSFVLPGNEDELFNHSRDVCHYFLQVEHDYEGKTYISTLTLLVHPARKRNNFEYGIYTIMGTMVLSIIYVTAKRSKSRQKFINF